MKVISYVGGILTVINDDKMFRGTADKPSFITGTNFYYEPNLKICDGVKLTAEQENQALEYINNYAFPVVEVLEVAVHAHCVDEDGNYLGYIQNDKNYREVVIDADIDFNKVYYDGIGFIERCLIDKATNKFVSKIGDTRTAENTKYAPNTLTNTEPFSTNRYQYDEMTKSWFITLQDAKECKLAGLKRKHSEDLDKLNRNTASFEVTSYTMQEAEATAYILDNTTSTPFIDALLVSRNLGELKIDLCNKILEKSRVYKTNCASLLGKYQRLIKQAETATSIEDLLVIKWE